MSTIDLNSLLTKYGLLCHTFAFNDLPINIKDRLDKKNHARFKDCYLSLIANVGPMFWTQLKANQSEWSDNSEVNNNPVDYFSSKVTDQLLQKAGLAIDAELLYPGTAPAPLTMLGELANWSTPSPLGLGLHAHYGPWFAYRALVKTTAPLQTNYSTKETNDKSVQSYTSNSESSVEQSKNDIYATSSPCMRCASTACVSACPGQAVSINAHFNISRCATHRLKENSTCKDQCHARNACPVGAKYRYSDEQSAYHMTHALQALVKWANST